MWVFFTVQVPMDDRHCLPTWISDIQDPFGTQVVVMLQDSGTTSNLRLSFGETMIVVLQILSYNSVCVLGELLIVGFEP